jgi:hypothetical protein
MMHTELVLDLKVARDHRKKVLKPCLKREIASGISAKLPTSIGRSWCIIGLSRSIYYYQSLKMIQS